MVETLGLIYATDSLSLVLHSTDLDHACHDGTICSPVL